MNVQIGFPVFSNITLLTLTGPWEVLSRVPNVQCQIVAASLEPVRASNGIAVMPTTTFDTCPPLTILCVPGGPGHLQAMENDGLIGFLKAQAPGCRYVTSVCTGSLVLGAAGLLESYRAATHWFLRHRLAHFGAVASADRVAIDRNRITSAGMTAGLDFAFTLAALLGGETEVQDIALQLEYAPAPPYPGDPAQAKPEAVAHFKERLASYRAAMDMADASLLKRKPAEAKHET